jgi:hypothetical protein
LEKLSIPELKKHQSIVALSKAAFPVGANPVREALQPEAIGTITEVTTQVSLRLDRHKLLTTRCAKL